MSQLSNYLEDALINAVLRNSSYTSPATVYVALYTSNPNEDNSGTEVSGGSYARTAVTFGAPSNGTSTNSADVTFPTATASWGTVTHFGILDANAAGNLLFYGALTTSKTIGSGDVANFTAGNLSCTLA